MALRQAQEEAGFDDRAKESLGFVARRLLKPIRNADRYAAIVEHQSEATFMSMHTSPERQQAWEKVNPLFEGTPAARFYEVVSASDRVPVVG